MMRSDPRRGSLCLPVGPDGWRYALVPLAMVLGATAGVLFYVVSATAAAAVVVGVTVADIAVQLVDLMTSETVLVSVKAGTKDREATLRRRSHAITFAASVAIGTAVGASFYILFGEPAEAVALGITLTSVTGRVTDMLRGASYVTAIWSVGTTARRSAARVASVLVRWVRAVRAGMKRIVEKARDYLDRFFDGPDGLDASAVRAA